MNNTNSIFDSFFKSLIEMNNNGIEMRISNCKKRGDTNTIIRISDTETQTRLYNYLTKQGYECFFLERNSRDNLYSSECRRMKINW